MLKDKILKLIKILQCSYYFKTLLQHRVAASVEHSHILCYLARATFRTVIDVGANRGQFALISRQCFPDAKIFSFEPLQEAATVFRRVFLTDPQVTLYEFAIGSEDREMIIHVSGADDSSSLLPIASLQSQIFPGTAEKEERKITVKRLDTILCKEEIAQPALLKIDVQGFEKDVLEGCKALLPCFSHVYVECSFMELYKGQALAHEIISFLEEFDFILSGVYNLSYDNKGIAIQGDFLFQRKSSPK